MPNPETLSEISFEVDGFTADDVIKDRLARSAMIREGAMRGNQICIESESLDAEARLLGVDMDYDENLDEFDAY